MFRLDQKVAIVIGGNGHLGKEFCKALYDFGAIVYCIDHVKLPADPETRFDSSRYIYREVDATEKVELEQLAKDIYLTQGRIDVLVNSSTMKGSDFYLPFEEVSLEGWNIGLLGNLTIPFLAIQAFIPYMKLKQRGSIINISSVYGVVGNDQRMYEGSNLHEIYVKENPTLNQVYSHGVYNASKGGINSFTKYLAAYYGKYNIRVNALSPGGVYHPNENSVFLEKYSDRTPLGRKANVDEMNGGVVYLASDASSYVTGHNLIIDGGFSIW